MTTLMNQLQARIETAVNKTGTYNEALQNLANLYGVPQGETGSRLIPVVQVFDPTINNATAAQNYLLYNSTIVSGGVPSLGMDFTSGTLDPRITFTRATNATVVNSAGLVSYAPHNLLTNSESFEAAAWTKTTGTTVVANAGTAPDATTTADRVVYDGTGTSGSFRIYQGNTISVLNQAYTCSVWMRADAPTTVRLYGNVVAGNHVTCNLTTTWQRFTTSGVGDGVASAQLLIYSPAADNSAISFYMWGAQLNVGPLQPYYFTTPKNLLGYTQEFDNAAWTKTTATVTANAVSAPDGTTSADLIIPNAGVVGTVAQTSITITSATPYVYSVYAKAGGFNWLRFQINGITGTRVAWFNLASGVTGTVQSLLTAAISSVGNGWYRCSVAFTSDNTTGSVSFVPTTSDNSTANGDGTSGVYLWGAQASNSASLNPYVYNPGAAPTSTAYYGPRFDYDPVTLAAKGLLIEEQRTNLLTYSDGTVANLGANSNVTDASSAISTSFTNSIEFGDNSVARYAYKSCTTTASVIYTLSVYVRMNDNSQPVVGTTNTAGDLGLVFENNLVTIASTVTASGGNVFRITASLTAVGGTGLNFGVIKYTTQTAKGFCVTGYQLEAGAFATSYIPTVASQVTRSADNASMIGDNFANWYNASEGTFSSVFDFVAAPLGTGNKGVYCAYGSASNNIVSYAANSTGILADVVADGGVAQAAFPSVALLAANTVYKDAFAYKLNDFARSLNAATVQTDTSGTVPAGLTEFRIGRDDGGSPTLNGHIRRILYYRTRLTNAQLQALTS